MKATRIGIVACVSLSCLLSGCRSPHYREVRATRAEHRADVIQLHKRLERERRANFDETRDFIHHRWDVRVDKWHDEEERERFTSLFY